jgi:hypothetical protein
MLCPIALPSEQDTGASSFSGLNTRLPVQRPSAPFDADHPLVFASLEAIGRIHSNLGVASKVLHVKVLHVIDRDPF